MSRPIRVLIVCAAILLAGVGALGWLAQRYRAMAPTKSVYDLERAPAIRARAPASPPSSSPVAPAPPPPVAEAAPEPPAEAPVAGPTIERAPTEAPQPVDPTAARDVRAFIEVRTALKSLVDDSPVAVRQLTAQFEQGIPEGAKGVPLHLSFLWTYRAKRSQKMNEVGITGERYAAVRDAYLAWKNGEPVDDEALEAALEARPEGLDAADLGDAERFDRLLAF